MHACRYMHAMVHVWRTEANYCDMWVQVVRHARQALSPPDQSRQALPHAPLKHHLHLAALGS